MYSAWRLQQEKGAHAKIGLFEYGDRIGGRLYTVTLPGLPHVKAEVGGMRYIPDRHIMVASLVDHLQLPDNTKFLTLRDGYDRLPITLAKQFDEEFAGGSPQG